MSTTQDKQIVRSFYQPFIMEDAFVEDTNFDIQVGDLEIDLSRIESSEIRDYNGCTSNFFEVRNAPVGAMFSLQGTVISVNRVKDGLTETSKLSCTIGYMNPDLTW